jgi:hypothetical protein
MKYYTYVIRFVDGYYYHGMAKYRGKNPLLDGYYGTPVTHRQKWTETMFWKEITGLFATLQDANAYEKSRISSCYKEDPFCLNANCGGYILEEHVRKGHDTLRSRKAFFYDPDWQQQNDAQARREERGIYSPGARSRGAANQPREVRQETGKRMGARSKELKNGICGLSDEERREYGSLGAKAQHAQRWMSTDENFDPYISSPCGLTKWQRHRGIDTKKRVRVL